MHLNPMVKLKIRVFVTALVTYVGLLSLVYLVHTLWYPLGNFGLGVALGAVTALVAVLHWRVRSDALDSLALYVLLVRVKILHDEKKLNLEDLGLQSE